jgi:hypothetical protein
VHPDLYCIRSAAKSTSSGPDLRPTAQNCLNMRKASQTKLRYPRRASVSWFRTLLLEVGRSDLAVIFPKTQSRRKRRYGRRDIIHLLLIILASTVAMIMGLYLGLSYHDEH